MRKALCLFGEPLLVFEVFWTFLLPVIEYYSPIWMSAKASHLRLLDYVVSKAVRLSDSLVECDLEYRRHRVAALCIVVTVVTLIMH